MGRNKYFLLLIICLVFCFNELKSADKWIIADSLANNPFSHYTKIDCNSGNCVAVGRNDGIPFSKYSTNNGKSWKYGFIDSSGVAKYFYRINMPSKDLAFAIADKRYYRSTDAGKTWEYGSLDIYANMLDMDFYDENFGVIVSALEVSITKDGGKTWETQVHQTMPASEDFFYLWGVEVLDRDNIYIFGQDINRNMQVMYSLNGGNNWEYTKIIPNYYLNDMHFFDSLNGIAVGFSKKLSESSLSKMNTVFKTNDGGNSWELLLDTSDKFSIGLRELIVDNDTLYALGGNQHFWKSTNKGQTWEQIKLPSNITQNTSSFAKAVDKVFVVAMSSGSLIYRYELDGYTDMADNPIEIPKYSSISLFPNPARDELTIKSEQPLLEYELTDVFGTTLNSEKELLMYGMRPELRVNTSKLSAGIYFLKIKTLDGIEYRKFIKE